LTFSPEKAKYGGDYFEMFRLKYAEGVR